MQKSGAYAFRLSIAVAFAGMLTSSAHAYLDPGTGSIILQVLLGGVAGLALTGKLFWHKLLSLLGMQREAQQGSAAVDKRGLEADASSRE